MGGSAESEGEAPTRASQLTLEVWHPGCWTLETTARVDAGLLAHSVYEYDDLVSARLTAYADAQADIDRLVSEIEGTELTRRVERVHQSFDPNRHAEAAGNATEELLVEYDPCNSIHDAFISRGFIPDEEIRIRDGYEYWTVIVTASRSAIRTRLDEIREEMDADINVEGATSARSGRVASGGVGRLSERQREVFELARRRGYYTWPREVSASELADELDVTKTTMLEHLRKAEAKLLAPED